MGPPDNRVAFNGRPDAPYPTTVGDAVILQIEVEFQKGGDQSAC
jgi:hypothetical protein